MIPWSCTMIRRWLFTIAVITGFTAEAITITIDRADVKTLQPQSSMQLNGWRPVTTKYQEIGVNVSPASNLASNVAPLHPVLNKLQEHMAASERQKARKNKPQEYSPPSILGSFSVFGHATKARGEGNSESKHESKVAKEYSFLIPPPRDAFRFEVESPKKLIFRETEPYLRQTQFVPQVHKPDIRGPTYYVKTSGLPQSPQKNRPLVTAYNIQSFVPKEFESLKVIGDNSGNDNKHVLQFPKTSIGPHYSKESTSERNYNRYEPQSQVTSGTGNYYSHAPNYKTTFERNPSYLVHESHEIGYVTPSYDYKYRQPGIFDGYLGSDLYGTTPRPDINKYAPPAKQVEKKEKNVHPTYFVAEPHREFVVPPGVWHMKQQALKPDINEVLPKLNRPAQFHQQAPVHAMPQSPQKLVYVRPEIQQQQQKQPFSSVIPLSINQRPPETDYETPESVSLKHYNEQQFVLQQQLIEQDRRRLREHELQRQKVLERQQIEEINKKQEEIRLLEQQQQQTVDETDLKKETRKPEQLKPLKISYKERIKPHVEEIPVKPTEPIYHYTEEPYPIQQGQYEVTKPKQPEEYQNTYQTTQSIGLQEEKHKKEFRPSRPTKPLRRRKPTYENLQKPEYSTELPTAFESYTEIPVQTTTWEPVSTTIATEKARPRKPIGNVPRRRRPSTTTSEPEPEYSVDTGNEEFLKYDGPEIHDASKRRRINKPSASYDVSSVDKKTGPKKVAQKVTSFDESLNIETTTEVITQTDVRPREPENVEKPNYFNSEHPPTVSTQTFSPANPIEYQVDGVTEYPKPGIVYANPEGAKLTKFEYYEPTGHDVRTGQYSPQTEDNIPLEHLFVRTEQNTYETTTPVAVSTGFYSGTPTRTTVKISKSQEQSKVSIHASSKTTTSEPPLSSTKAHNRIRPLRYGNATRPRFSVKEYKSRLEYKNKLMQASTSSTEASVRQKSAGSRNSQSQTGSDNYRESPGRYRYMSRVLQKTTSTTTPSYDSTTDSGSDSTTERTNKFTPKRRMNPNLYRNRLPPKQNRHENTENSSSTQNTTRVENSFTTVRRRVPHPTLKNERNSEKKASTSKEMSVEETSFYDSPPTTTSIDGVNEINKENTDHNSDDIQKVDSNATSPNTASKESSESLQTKKFSYVETVTPINSPFDEELFAKASQSVADLTSSASALYNKPGMFKAVSSVHDSRKGLITTEEPTLPIEAFFHELGKKE